MLSESILRGAEFDLGQLPPSGSRDAFSDNLHRLLDSPTSGLRIGFNSSLQLALRRLAEDADVILDSSTRCSPSGRGSRSRGGCGAEGCHTCGAATAEAAVGSRGNGGRPLLNRGCLSRVSALALIGGKELTRQVPCVDKALHRLRTAVSLLRARKPTEKPGCRNLEEQATDAIAHVNVACNRNGTNST